MSINLQEPLKLETVEIATHTPAKWVVIWLHGLGADGHDFVGILPELKLKDEYAIKFIFPHAPIRPVTINQGMSMRAWYDITSLTRVEDDEAGILQSSTAVLQLISEQLELGIPSDRIILAGFSQGGAIALHAALSCNQLLGGVLGLSTYLPLSRKVPLAHEAKKQQLPIFLMHGEHDDVIPLMVAKLGRDVLLQRGYQVVWRQYPMAHEVCVPELADIRTWFLTHITKE